LILLFIPILFSCVDGINPGRKTHHYGEQAQGGC